MFKIQTLNAISPIIHESLSAENYVISANEPTPDGILVRSAAMHDLELPESHTALLQAIARDSIVPFLQVSAPHHV